MREKMKICFSLSTLISQKQQRFLIFEQEEKIDRQGNRTVIKRVKYSPKKEKKLVGRTTQEKTVEQDSYEIKNEIRSFKTGIIFKDTHEFVT